MSVAARSEWIVVLKRPMFHLGAPFDEALDLYG
jgi:hypothetical protein